MGALSEMRLLMGPGTPGAPAPPGGGGGRGRAAEETGGGGGCSPGREDGDRAAAVSAERGVGWMAPPGPLLLVGGITPGRPGTPGPPGPPAPNWAAKGGGSGRWGWPPKAWRPSRVPGCFGTLVGLC